MEIEVPISGDFEPGQISEDDVMSGNMVMLNIVRDILANNSNLAQSESNGSLLTLSSQSKVNEVNAKYKDLCDMIGVPVK